MNLLLTLPLAFAAGMLTIFSPCVLPLAPIVVAAARARDPRGPIALGFGLAATFGIVGGVLASFGVEFGDSDLARAASAIVMVAIGAALLVPAIGERIERRLGFVGRAADVMSERLPNAGLAGQAAAGVVLAFAWAPCAGPILGAALLLAAKGGSLAAAIATMTAYAVGAASALIGAGYAAGRVASKARFVWAGAGGRLALGAAFVLIGAAVLTGFDHHIEAVLVAAMPDWLTAFATSL
ncbi:cytochrome c biogenesis CcdA family protein [Roseiarcus sp.]|uniref:cytochrome c biogenesis CcdA family protein n=1 Tax=Roseiarcus sp. TaxID=1969460 RepID=UPI003D0FC584